MTVRFSSSTQLSESGYLGVAADEAMLANTTVYASVTSNNPTLTAAQLVNGIIDLSGQTGAQTVTTDTAANIVALLPNLQVGSSFDIMIHNNHSASGAATLTAGAGVTISGTAAMPINTGQLFKGVVTNATAGAYAVTIYALLKTAS